jgi:succinate-acetate transporter protein
MPASVFLRPLGTPMPLGFLGLTAVTFVVSGQQLGWIPPGQAHQVALVAVGFAFPAQFLASVYGFLCRDAAAATGMGLLAVTWLAFGLLTLGAPPGTTSRTTGLLLLVAGLLLLVPAAATGTSKTVATAVLSFAALRFFFTGAYEFSAASAWKTAAGVMGLVLAGTALYAAFALLWESRRHRTVLPVGRRGPGRTAVTGAAPDQLGEVVHEPGVRREL